MQFCVDLQRSCPAVQRASISVSVDSSDYDAVCAAVRDALASGVELTWSAPFIDPYAVPKPEAGEAVVWGY